MAETASLGSQITALRARAAWLNGRPDKVAAPLDVAAELAERIRRHRFRKVCAWAGERGIVPDGADTRRR
jgi:hypothetical protein